MRGTFSIPPVLSFSRFAGAILALALGFFVSIASASEGKWDYIVMCDTDLGTGQEVGYLTLHVDIPISNAKHKAVMGGAKTQTATLASPAVASNQKEQTVLSALSGDGDFDQALTVVAGEAATMSANLPGLSDFLLARRTGDTEGFKQWTLNARPLQLIATKDAATGASVLSYKRLMAELRVQVKLGPDYKDVMAGLQSPNDSVFQAAVDRVVLATNKATNGGIDYGDFAVQVLNSLKNRKAPVAFTQATMAAGITNSAQ
jgi:hypothetical protein